MKNKDMWLHPFNVYVSRKDAGGMIYTLTVPMALAMVLFLVVLLNVLLWGSIGLYEAVTYIT